ncbi:HAMP domain-containing sensor histidine kinase [Glaciihabitans sp. UYNi722]|uniref:sensor histidine kinase n=1 Tax=Glaciihabitans sp. UYNi722 TaxID=3156344 RepID=UPI003397DBB2
MHEHVSSWWSSVSLRTKITGVTVLLVTLGLLVAGVGTMTVLRNTLTSDVDRKVEIAAKGVTGVVDPNDSTRCTQTNADPNTIFAILDANGDLLCSNKKDADSSMPRLTNLALPSVLKLSAGTFTVWDRSHAEQWRAKAVPAQTPDGDYATIVVGLSLAETNRIIGNYVTTFLGFGLSVIILGAALTRLLVTSTFTPLREVEATAAAIAEGDFSQRLPGATPNTEVGRLNRSLNTMLNRIDRAFADRARTIEQMRRFVGDASHELRTPLVSVRGYAELYRMGALQKPEDVAQAMERIEKEAIRMGELVQDLLELARIDEAKPLQLGPVDLVPIARDVALDTMASAPDRDVTVVVDTAPPRVAKEAQPELASTAASAATGPIAFAGAQLARLRRRPVRAGQPSIVVPDAPVVEPPTAPAIVLAEENKIRQVVTNLMGNAMRFTPAGSPIELAVHVDPARRTAMLDVIDHGEGVPPQIRDKIFQRFWRADTSRTRETGGSGLGLAIVSGIIASHKGQVTVLETPGGGATFRITLPLLPDGYTPPTAPTAP